MDGGQQTNQTSEPVIYLNGQFIPRSQAKVDVEDRGFVFADGVYEVVRYYWGQPLAMDLHIQRLRRSLAAVRIEADAFVDSLQATSDLLVKRNGMPNASVYVQVSRGSSPRNHVIPQGIRPTVMAIAYPAHDIDTEPAPRCIRATLEPDLRWARCDIKSLMLLANVLAKAQAHDRDAHEAILHRQNIVTEGSSTTVLVIRKGELWTHPANELILDSITRKLVLQLAAEQGLKVVEQAITTDQLLEAQEVMIAGTTTHLAAVTHINDKPISQAQAGPITSLLYTRLLNLIRSKCKP